MKQVIVEQFGPPENLKIVEHPTPLPGAGAGAGAGQVLVRLTSIGLNQADLMGRRGYYKASTGEPPYTPGIEGGGVIEAVGEGVDPSRIGQRISLAPSVPRGVHGPHGGTYRTHMLVDANVALPAPDAIPDDQLGAIWLAYFTAWGALVWKFGLKPGQFVALPAASSSVALAAAQVVRHHGAIPIGLTSSPDKVAAVRALDTNAFEHLIVTHDRDAEGARVMRPWHTEIRRLTGGHGIDLFFDPIAAGEYLSTEIRCLAQHGVICLYGLLGAPSVVNLQPLIIKRGRIEVFSLYELVDAGESVWRPVCEQILAQFANGTFRQHIAGHYSLDDVRRAHAEMERGDHVGKLVLLP